MLLIDLEDEEAPLAPTPDIEVDEAHSDSDDEPRGANTPALAQIERNRANRAIFSDFLEHEIAERDKAPELDDSFHSKLPDSSTRIIDDPRDYQTELFEKAKAENVIAVLDTGSGKTLIAALLMRDVEDQELVDRADGKAPRISFFLVNSVYLVLQQQRMLANNLSTTPALLHGNTKEDLWRAFEWHDLFKKNKAIVCTAEVLNQCLMHSFLSIEQINLIVFDEAHHTKKGHPYARIIKDYYLPQHQSHRRPKIFGMTASPVDAKGDIRAAAL